MTEVKETDYLGKINERSSFNVSRDLNVIRFLKDLEEQFGAEAVCTMVLALAPSGTSIDLKYPKFTTFLTALSAGLNGGADKSTDPDEEYNGPDLNGRRAA